MGRAGPRARPRALPGARPRVLPFGDAAVLVELGTAVDRALNRRVHRLADGLGRRLVASDGWGAPVAGIASLLVPFDAGVIDPAAARRAIEDLLATGALETAAPASDAVPEPDHQPIELLVRYGGADGPDLEAAAGQLGLSPARLVELHAATTYDVLAVGFQPGFAYLGVLPESLRLPRRETPRTSVPAGSVAIADAMTAVYPFDSPGGWHLIGRTDERLWDPTASPPARLAAGDRVRFAPDVRRRG